MSHRADGSFAARVRSRRNHRRGENASSRRLRAALAERPEGVMSLYYDYLIQLRHEELMREAEKHRYNRRSHLRRRRRTLPS
jgi:hypothetical protein